MSVPWNLPILEISWDQGKTWQTQYPPSIGPATLFRVRLEDGTLLWMGQAEPKSVECPGCGGTGRRIEFEYRTVSRVTDLRCIP